MGLYKRCAHKHPGKCPCPWWARGKFSGEPKERRLNLEQWSGKRLASRSEAQKAYDHWRQSTTRELPKGGVETFPELARLWFSRRASRLRDARNIEWRLKQILELLPDKLPTLLDIERVIQELEKRQLARATRNRYLADIRRIGNWALDRELVRSWPRIRIPAEDNRRRFRVTPIMEKALLDHAYSQDITDLMILALDTGLRLGELLGLRPTDISEDHVITITGDRAKSGKTREVPLATARSREVIKRRSSVGLLFPLGRHVYRHGWEVTRTNAELPHIVFHDLRAEYASRLVELGVPLSHVRDLLGHSTITVTERYDRKVLEALKRSAGLLEGGAQ